jgi:hypothetical protein
VRERRARIGPCRGEYLDRFSKQQTKHVDMVDAHVQQSQPAVSFQELLPMGNGPYFDGSDDRRAQVAVTEDLPQDRID